MLVYIWWLEKASQMWYHFNQFSQPQTQEMWGVVQLCDRYYSQLRHQLYDKVYLCTSLFSLSKFCCRFFFRFLISFSPFGLLFPFFFWVLNFCYFSFSLQKNSWLDIYRILFDTYKLQLNIVQLLNSKTQFLLFYNSCSLSM